MTNCSFIHKSQDICVVGKTKFNNHDRIKEHEMQMSEAHMEATKPINSTTVTRYAYKFT